MNLLISPNEALEITLQQPVSSKTIDFINQFRLEFFKIEKVDSRSSSLLFFFNLLQAGRIQGIREERQRRKITHIEKEI